VRYDRKERGNKLIMKLNLSNNIDRNKAETYLKKLIEKKAKIELKEFKPSRSNQANKYFHVCCAILSDYSGYTIDEIKIIIKDQLEFMTYTKNGHKFYRSSANLDTDEFTLLVDFTRSFGEDHGQYIPTPEEYYDNQFDIEKQFNHLI